MEKKKILVISIIVITIVTLGSFLWTGRARTDVYLKNFEVSSDGKTMTLEVGVSSSVGYVRKMKRTSGGTNYYYTFYSTFGINSKIGAKDTFEIELDENVDEIYFYTGDKGYRLVLKQDTDGEWKRPDVRQVETGIENIIAQIYNVSDSGATIIITDTNKVPHTYGEWYKIEKNVNGDWVDLKPIIDDYGFISIGYLPDKNNEVKFDMNWEWLYGKLQPGSYRLVKEVGSKYIYIPFEIT